MLTYESRTSRTITRAEALQDELAATRARGYSTDNEEFMDGMAAIAVPIRDNEGRLLTTLSLHAPVQRLDLAALITKLQPLLKAAGKLESLAQN